MTYDTSSPADNSPVSAFPANERQLRVFLETIMGVNHITATGADQGRHTNVQMTALVDHPAPIAGRAQLYMIETTFGTDLFYMNGEGDIINLVKGDTTPITLPGSDLEVASIYSNYYLGKVVELEIDAGEIEIDWTAGQYFIYDNTESHTITFTNMPAIGSGIGQTICLNIDNAGDFGITLDASLGYAVYVRSIDLGEPFVGRTRLICTVDVDGIVDVVPLLDFVANV